MSKRSVFLPLAFSAFVLVAGTAALALSGSNKTAAASEAAVTASLAPQPAASMIKAESVIKQDQGKEKEREEKDDDEEEDDDANLKAALTPAQAAEAAQITYPGSTVKKSPKLENEDGVTVYNVALLTADGKKLEVKVNGDNGTIVKAESEEEDDDKEGPDGDGDGETADDGVAQHASK